MLVGSLAQDVSPGGSLSDSSEGLFHRGEGPARIYAFLQKKQQPTNKNQVVKTSKIPHKENQTSHVKTLSIFLWVGRWTRLGSWPSLP